MNKKLFLLNILLVIGLLLAACGTSIGTIPAKNQSGMHNAALALQATAEPPIVFPTIVINPTPAPGGGSFMQIDPTTLLLYILVGAVIFIALIAVLKK